MRRHGKNGALYATTASTGTPAAIANVFEWVLNMTRQRADATGFGDTNLVYTMGLPDVQGTFQARWNDDANPLFTGAQSEGGILMELYPDHTNAVTKKASGPAYIDASITVNFNSTIDIRGAFVAAGSWTIAL
jgi:hypothetical protein